MITDVAILEMQEILVRVDLLATEAARKSIAYYPIFKTLEKINNNSQFHILRKTMTYRKLSNMIEYDKCKKCIEELLFVANDYQKNHDIKKPIKNFIEKILERGYIFNLYKMAVNNCKDWESIINICLDRLDRYKYEISPTSLAYFESNIRNLTRNNRMPYVDTKSKINIKKMTQDVIDRVDNISTKSGTNINDMSSIINKSINIDNCSVTNANYQIDDLANNLSIFEAQNEDTLDD